MTGSDDTMRSEIVTSIALVIGWVAKKHIGIGTWREFIWCSGNHVWVTEVPKYTQMTVVGRSTKKNLKGREKAVRFARPAVEKICGSGKSLGPEARRHA